MGAKENGVWSRCMIALNRKFPFARMYRNNVGSGWAGPGFTLRPGQTYTAKGGERVITVPSFIEFGLIKGSGDGIGYDSITVTPEMVGRKIAVFASIETKAGKGRAAKEQAAWRDQVRAAGGIAIIINDPDQLNLELPFTT